VGRKRKRKNVKLKLFLAEGGGGITYDRLSGKELSKKQAKLVLRQHFVDVLETFGLAVHNLAEAVKGTKTRS
jgi:hypothetical protein